MKKTLIKILIPMISLMICNCVFADVEEEVVVLTNVDYTASVTKASSTDSVAMNPATGTHPGLSTVFTLQTNGGDDYFDYTITSYIDIDGGRVSAFGDDGRLLFAHDTILPDLTAVNNAKSGTLPSKNVFACPTSINVTNGRSASFETNYKDFGNCYVILDNGAETGDITHTVTGSTSANTYEQDKDQSGSYKSVIVFTITSK